MEIREYIKNSINAKNQILNDSEFIDTIQKIADAISTAYKSNKKLLIMGNGGSAADSNHTAAEFVSRFIINRKALPAISLSANQSVLTAIANDDDFKYIFSRQIEALGEKDDILIGISTSGTSKNILEGFEKAKEKNITTIFLTGKNAQYEADYVLKIPSDMTSIIQEAHIMLLHIICALVEEKL